jgi:predicted DsbA family dithiol-disulfide isomerase
VAVLNRSREATPDGIKIIGAQPYPVFEKAIKESLAEQAGRN